MVRSVPPRRPRSLQEELRQGRPFASVGQEAALGILRTADVVRRSVASVLLPHGISPQQYNVLRIVRGAGEPGIPTLEIAARTIERAPGITRLLDGLEAKGLVRRVRCARDRRQVLCHLTPAGGELLASLDEPVLAANAHVEVLSRRDLAELVRLLGLIRAAAPTEDEDIPSRPAAGRRTKGASR